MALVKAVDPRVSFAELQQWPDDGRRYELYDGEVIVVPSPLPRHQLVVVRIADLLLDSPGTVRGLTLVSPIDIVFSDHDVLQPDVVFFRENRRAWIDMMQAIRVPPDLVVEVLSRATGVRDRGRKMQLYARFGVAEYWIVDPVANALELYALESGRYGSPLVLTERDQVRSATLAGLEFEARRIFKEE
jgi:Uma2 family endonuclease